jgi:hypothetical protein
MLATAAAIFSLLLITTGLAKLARPHDVQRALTELGFPRIPGLGLLVGFIEVGVGIGSLLIPEFLLLQGVLFAVFAAWVVVALRSGLPIASCGCLGRSDTPPTASHVFLNLLAVVVSLGAAVGDPLSLGAGLELVAQVVVVLAGLFLSYVVLTDLAHLSGVARR